MKFFFQNFHIERAQNSVNNSTICFDFIKIIIAIKKKGLINLVNKSTICFDFIKIIVMRKEKYGNVLAVRIML
jgi:hypothetical protein